MMPNFFGYYGNGYTGLGDVTAITKSYSNLVWIDPAQESDETLLQKFKNAQVNQQNVILVVTTLLFKYPSTDLLPDFAKRFVDLYSKISKYTGLIFAYFLFDEPYRSDDNHIHLGSKQVTANLDAAAVTIANYTIKPTMISAAGNEFDKFGIPKSVSIIGMYRYSYNTAGYQLIWSFMNLLLKKKSEQKIIAVADSFEWPDKEISFSTENRILNFNNTWKWLIKYFGKDVIGVCPFLYQSSPMGQGADKMPNVRAYMKNWAEEILGLQGVA
jgi:hypothetical protein